MERLTVGSEGVRRIRKKILLIQRGVSRCFRQRRGAPRPKKSLPSNEASADVSSSEVGSRIPINPSNEAKPMLQGSEEESRDREIPIPQRGMEKSVHVRVKRVLPEAKLHKREEDAGLRACSQEGIPFPFVRAPALFTRTSVFQKRKPQCRIPEKEATSKR